MLEQVQLEIFKNMFASIAEEMGVVMQRSAYSPNIKERLDFSCALFDPRGEMIAQAAHIPVHLGSMPMSVRAALDAFELEPGDAVILNDPFAGGTHLPQLLAHRRGELRHAQDVAGHGVHVPGRAGRRLAPVRSRQAAEPIDEQAVLTGCEAHRDVAGKR